MVMGVNRNDQRSLAYSGTVISATTSGTSYLGPFYNDHFSDIRVGLEVEAESGTTPALAWAMEYQSPSDLGWENLLDLAGAQVAGVSFAAAAVGLRFLDMSTNVLSEEDATAQVLTYGTNYRKYGNLFLPFSMRVKLTLTGTGAVTKTINAFVMGIAA